MAREGMCICKEVGNSGKFAVSFKKGERNKCPKLDYLIHDAVE